MNRKFKTMVKLHVNIKKPSRKHKWLLVGGFALALTVLVGAILLAFKWPFSERELTDSIQQMIPSTAVKVDRFRIKVFPNPGCEADNVTVRRIPEDPSLPPLVAVQQIIIRAHYPDLFIRPGYIAHIVLNGLVIKILPHTARATGSASGTQNSLTTRVGEISVKGAILQVGRSDDKPPLIFQIHALDLRSVSRDTPFRFAVALTNALPPGEIIASGELGPWNRAEWGKTPVSGGDRFQQAALSALPGIGGTLSSDDRFAGTLDQIRVNGAVNIPNFLLKMAGHTTPVHTSYRATVNATNGNVALEDVDTTIAETRIMSSGKIAGEPGRKGKTTEIAVNVKNGKIQDILRLFVSDPRSPLDGDTAFQASIRIPPQGRPFLKELLLRGNFAIDGGRFTKAETQNSVDDLSRRARGESHGKGADRDAESVASDLSGNIEIGSGIAHFTQVVFRAPGAVAQMSGTYDLIGQKVDFHGTLKTQAELSETTDGMKSILLKPLNRFFKRKHAGAAVPVQITGTYQNPHFGVVLNPAEALKK